MDEVEEVLVLASDLEIIRSALNVAHMFSMSQDLSDQYRKLSNRQQYSAMTKTLESSLSKVEAYLALLEQQSDEEQEDE